MLYQKLSINTHNKQLTVVDIILCCIAITASLLIAKPVYANTENKIELPSVPAQLLAGEQIPVLQMLADTSTSMNTSLNSSETRIQAVKKALLDIVQDLYDSDSPIHLGLARLKASHGAELLVYPNTVAENYTTLKNKINNLSATDRNTPLASALGQILRFMVEGHNKPLTYRSQAPIDAYEILSKSAVNSTGIDSGDLVSPVKNQCQQPHLIMLTDGQPTRDNNVARTLSNITNGVANKKLARVADFGAHVDDLLPDIDGKQIMKTHLVVFANQSLFNSSTVKETVEHGLGGRYYANDVDSLLNSFKSIIKSTTTRSGTLGYPAFANQRNVANNKLYFAEYDTSDWSGDISCYTLDASGKINKKCWSAKEKLDRKNPKDRTMITYNNGGIAFNPKTPNVLSTLSPQMRQDLDFDGNGLLRMKLLRDVNKKQNSYRDIPTLSDNLGGLLHYIGTPISDWDNRLRLSKPNLAESYANFKKTVNSDPIICSGNNSPFGIQCFDAAKGEEILAYAPGGTTRISEFLSLSYPHGSYNSGLSLVEDTLVGGDWKTLYIFCSGISPDKQCSALDVTSRKFSEKDAANLVLWEFNTNQIPEIGNVITVPSIILHDSTPGESGGESSYTLIPNGYNSSANKACVIAVKNKTTRSSWVRGSDYHVICDDTNNNDTATAVRAVDSNNNGMADLLYITTSQGRILRIDHLDQSPNAWKIGAEVANLGRAITSKPLIVKPLTQINNAQPGLIVLVGTGRFLTKSDRNDNQQEYFVSILDNVSGFGNTIQISDLVEQTLSVAENNLLSLTKNDIDYQQKSGAIIKFSNGYKIISSPQLYADKVAFNAIRPGKIDENCNQEFKDSSQLVIANAINLTNSDKPIFDITNDGSINNTDDMLDNGTAPAGKTFTNGLFSAPRIIGNLLFQNSDVIPDSNKEDEIDEINNITGITLTPPPTNNAGRRSWQELRRR